MALDLVALCDDRLVARSRDSPHSCLQVEECYSMMVVLEAHKRADFEEGIVAVAGAHRRYIVVEMVEVAEMLRRRMSKDLLGSRSMSYT